MKKYKLVFNLDYKFLCWGMPDSSLSGKFTQEIDVGGQREFTLRYQHKTHFEVSDIKEDGNGIYAFLQYPQKEQILRLNCPIEFHYKEEYEQFTDCNTNVYHGIVTLTENE